VLEAASAAGVYRVVVTSSFAAIGYSPKPSGLPHDETDWTDPAGQSPYVKSKAMCERAAWDFATAHPDRPELAVVNPVGVFGPVLGPDFSTSLGIIKLLLDSAIPVLPRAWSGREPRTDARGAGLVGAGRCESGAAAA
jgi:nucleoside-diphosphate-sugar epimerase